MAIDCLHEPLMVAFAKTFGASVGIFAAAMAWLLNNCLRWLIWTVGELRREYELIKGLRAEITNNSWSESNWSDPAQGEKLIADLSANLGPDKPWIPYVAVADMDFVFDSIKGSLGRLPTRAFNTIVSYYGLSAGLSTQLTDLRTDAYASLSRERQLKVLRWIHVLGAEVADAAQKAIEALENRLIALQVIYGISLAALAIALLLLAPRFDRDRQGLCCSVDYTGGRMGFRMRCCS